METGPRGPVTGRLDSHPVDLPDGVAMETGPRGPVTEGFDRVLAWPDGDVAMETGPRGPVTAGADNTFQMSNMGSQWRPAREGR